MPDAAAPGKIARRRRQACCRSRSKPAARSRCRSAGSSRPIEKRSAGPFDLVVGADGDRLAKRAAGLTLRELRHRGHGAEAILGALAFALGLADDEAPRSSAELARLAATRPFVFRTDAKGGADTLRVTSTLLA